MSKSPENLAIQPIVETPMPLEGQKKVFGTSVYGTLKLEEGEEDLMEIVPELKSDCAAPGESEDDLLEVVPEPKVNLGDLIDETLNERRPEANPMATQDIAPKLENPTGDPQNVALSQLKQVAWKIAGVIQKSRFIEGDLLAVMLVSKEMKDNALGLPTAKLDPKNNPKPEIFEPSAKEMIRELRDGVYLILKPEKGSVFVMGGKRAEIIAPEAIELTYWKIARTMDFLNMSDEIETGHKLDKERKMEDPKVFL